MSSPYEDLPARAFWRSGVSERAPLDPGDLYHPRFPITRAMKVATAGSCFAQHVGRALRGANFRILDAEPLPNEIPDSVAHSFGYRLFSARYGNIYTVRQLLQLLREAEGEFTPAEPVWRRGERSFDSQRPSVEPEGLDSPELVAQHRAVHLAGVRSVLREADLFVFTLGLTEAWVHAATGTVYPTAPGTIAGSHDPETYVFRNFDALEVLADFEEFRARIKALNPDLKFLCTVSPVPLTATASGEHVEVATTYSKAVLRSVCGMLVARHEDVDYFPSFELITSQNARGAYYQPNLRNVATQGVAAAMQLFLSAHGIKPRAAVDPDAVGAAAKAARAARLAKVNERRRRRLERAGRAQSESEVCEEALLEAFAK